MVPADSGTNRCLILTFWVLVLTLEGLYGLGPAYLKDFLLLHEPTLLWSAQEDRSKLEKEPSLLLFLKKYFISVGILNAFKCLKYFNV